jgi:hypothetical protein
VALRGNEPPIVVIGELKLGFNLELVLQGSIGRRPAMKSGLPFAPRNGLAASAIRACVSFAGSWASRRVDNRSRRSTRKDFVPLDWRNASPEILCIQDLSLPVDPQPPVGIVHPDPC